MSANPTKNLIINPTYSASSLASRGERIHLEKDRSKAWDSHSQKTTSPQECEPFIHEHEPPILVNK